MSTVYQLLDSLPNTQSEIDETPFLDQKYISRSLDLINNALQKGADVTQMPNGDILMTEVKTVTYRYAWNSDKKKFDRNKNRAHLHSNDD